MHGLCQVIPSIYYDTGKTELFAAATCIYSHLTDTLSMANMANESVSKNESRVAFDLRIGNGIGRA